MSRTRHQINVTPSKESAKQLFKFSTVRCHMHEMMPQNISFLHVSIGTLPVNVYRISYLYVYVRISDLRVGLPVIGLPYTSRSTYRLYEYLPTYSIVIYAALFTDIGSSFKTSFRENQPPHQPKRFLLEFLLFLGLKDARIGGERGGVGHEVDNVTIVFK